jgi:hypothetical protein
MRSSISSSESRPLLYSKLLAVLCALVLLSLECGYSFALTWSGTYRRVSQQYADAVQARPSNPGAPPSVLMVGNSLLLDAVDVDRFQQLTADRLRLYPLFLEGTAYLDWFYGLQRLFRRGSRPDVVIVGLGLDGVVQSSVRQEYAPRLLFTPSDLLAISREAGLDRTVTTSLVLSHWSAFWDMRHVIRVQVMTRTLPYFERLYLTDLWSDLKAKRAARVDPRGEGVAIARLQRLRQLCEAHGARLLVLVPPTPSVPSAIQQLTFVADSARVDVLMPVNPATLPARYFRPDDIHVNEDGAAVFTAALAADLPARIVERRVASIQSEVSASSHR